MFIGKSTYSILRKENIKADQLSFKHVSCVSKYDFQQRTSKKGPIEKSLSEDETYKIKRYKKLFNAAYAVVKHNWPYLNYKACLNLITQVVNVFLM